MADCNKETNNNNLEFILSPLRKNDQKSMACFKMHKIEEKTLVTKPVPKPQLYWNMSVLPTENLKLLIK